MANIWYLNYENNNVISCILSCYLDNLDNKQEWEGKGGEDENDGEQGQDDGADAGPLVAPARALHGAGAGAGDRHRNHGHSRNELCWLDLEFI